jgi:outer membrane immunogenic protein
VPVKQTFGGHGWLARVGGGYDYQFTSRIVAGAFADFDFSELEGTIQDGFFTRSSSIKQEWSWAAGARVGLLATPEILTYVNAGFSSAHFSSGSMVTAAAAVALPPAGAPTGIVTPDFTQNGWFFGGGVEAALGSGWFWRNEYRVAYYDSHKIPQPNTGTLFATQRFNDIDFKPTVQTFTTQVVYKFGPGRNVAPEPRARGPVAVRWTGLHVDAGVGYGLWTADVTTSSIPQSLGEAPIVIPQRYGGKGWLGRIGGGYDYQFGGRFVAGAFADFDMSSLKGTVADPAIPLAGSIKQQWAWAAGGRAGVLATPDILFYADGGYTSAHFSAASMIDPSGLKLGGTWNTPAFTQSGWFVGGGTEYAMNWFVPGLFVRTEYRYADYGTQTLTNTVAGAPVPSGVGPLSQLNNINFKPRVQTITTELIYRFNWGR